MVTALISRLLIFSFGMLYPSYASNKAIQSTNSSEHPRWIVYWIVFALFSIFEFFADPFLSFWFSFYNELKVLLMLWLFILEARGAGILYRKIIQPLFSSREQDIDDCIAKIREYGNKVIKKMASGVLSFLGYIIMTMVIRAFPKLLRLNSQMITTYVQPNICSVTSSTTCRPIFPALMPTTAATSDTDDRSTDADNDVQFQQPTPKRQASRRGRSVSRKTSSTCLTNQRRSTRKKD